MQSQHPQAEQAKIPAVPWTTRDVWFGLIAFGVWLALFIAFEALVSYFALEVNIGLTIGIAEAALLLPVWRLTIRKYGVGWRALGLRSFKGRVVGLGCGLMLLSLAFNMVYALFLAQFGWRMQVDLVSVFKELSSPWLLFIGGAFIAPFVEEVFFRGFVFAGLLPQFGWQKGAMISASLFALLHLTPLAVIPIFILGYIFAFLYYRSGSIWPAILMHVLTNSVALGSQMLLARYGDFLF